MKKIYIQVGHGASDAGAVSGGRLEKDDNLRLALAIKKYLDGQNVEVKFSRLTDVENSESACVTEANNWGADYYLALHRNSSQTDARGNEIWIWSKASDTTRAKAQNILNKVNSMTGSSDRGVKYGMPGGGDYYVNKNTNCHSALLEVGFITNAFDNKTFDENLDKLAKGLAVILMSLVGVTYVGPKKTEPKKVTYAVQIGSYSDKASADKVVSACKTLGISAIVKEV